MVVSLGRRAEGSSKDDGFGYDKLEAEMGSYRPVASVVIPCYLHAAELRRCLEGLHRQTIQEPFEIIVVESAGEPEVKQLVHAHKGVRLALSSSRLGPGPARNVGANLAAAEVLAFTDADCIPDPGWLEEAVGALEAGATVVGGAVLDARPMHPVAVADNVLQFPDWLPGRTEGPAEHFPGCNIAIHRSNFRQIGGFPEHLEVRGSDVLFCQKASGRWPSGLRFSPRMIVRHGGATRVAVFLRRQAALGFSRGLLGYYVKPSVRRLGARALFVAPLAFGRLAYIMGRWARWQPFSLPRILPTLPLLVIGLLAWGIGFRRGLASSETACMSE